jgi:hypothetical protein
VPSAPITVVRTSANTPQVITVNISKTIPFVLKAVAVDDVM